MTKKIPSPITPNPSPEAESPAVAIIGGGYWGKNLVRNFYDLNSLKLVCDKNETILADYEDQYKGIETCLALKTVSSAGHPLKMEKKTKYSTTKQEKKVFVDALSACMLQHGEIYAAYLFGSFVTEKSFADVDLGVLLRRESEDMLEYEIELESKLEKLARFRLDVRVLNKAPISFAQNVIRYGRLILDREPNMRSDFESYVLKKYFDFVRFRRMYLAEVINAPL
jgi:uncharacterized protein